MIILDVYCAIANSFCWPRANGNDIADDASVGTGYRKKCQTCLYIDNIIIICSYILPMVGTMCYELMNS